MGAPPAPPPPAPAAPPPVPTRTRFPTPTPTLNPLIPTRSPFKYTASPPFFTNDVYGAACGNWGGVAGQVFNIDGSPLAGVSGRGAPTDAVSA